MNFQFRNRRSRSMRLAWRRKPAVPRRWPTAAGSTRRWRSGSSSSAIRSPKAATAGAGQFPAAAVERDRVRCLQSAGGLRRHPQRRADGRRHLRQPAGDRRRTARRAGLRPGSRGLLGLVRGRREPRAAGEPGSAGGRRRSIDTAARTSRWSISAPTTSCRADQDPALIRDELAILVGQLRAANPSIRVLLAQVIPVSSGNATETNQIAVLNSADRVAGRVPEHDRIAGDRGGPVHRLQRTDRLVRRRASHRRRRAEDGGEMAARAEGRHPVGAGKRQVGRGRRAGSLQRRLRAGPLLVFLFQASSSTSLSST